MFDLGDRRCLACGGVSLDVGDGMYMCPARYLSPHGVDFLSLVAEELDFNNDASVAEHKAAIRRAAKRFAP